MVLFPFQNRKEPEFLALNTTAGDGGHISRPFHSNAYLDLDRDGNSDIFLTAEDRFEIWLNNPSTSASSEGAEDTLKYKLEKTIGLENIFSYGALFYKALKTRSPLTKGSRWSF